MRSIEVNGVVYVASATGTEQDCSGCAARGVRSVCGVLNKACGEKPQIYKREDGVDDLGNYGVSVLNAAWWGWQEGVAHAAKREDGVDDLGNYSVSALNAAWWGWQVGD